MPAGVPVAAVSIGGARNAALIAVKILATSDDALLDRLEEFASDLERQVDEKNRALKSQL